MKYIYIICFLWVCSTAFAQRDTIFLKDPLSDLYLSASDSAGCVPMQVNFKASLSHNIRFRWDFGDGETSTLPNPTHTYLRTGSYSLNVVAYYNKDSILLTQPDWINAYPVAYPNFSTANKCACDLPANLTFFNNSNNSAQYTWLFVGAEMTEFDGFNPPPIAYNQAGKYPVSLIATTQYGCIDTLTLENYVNVGHEIAFSADKTTANCPPFPVSFTDKSLGCATKWKWDFGDGTSPSLSRDPVHIYSKAGDYTVKLAVTYQDGCTDSLIQTHYIQVGGPEATLVMSPLEVCENEGVEFRFTASAYLFLEFAPEDVKLLKGTKNEPSTYTHHFKTAGVFHPSYTVIDSSGCLNKFYVSDSIRVLPRPTADFMASTSFGKKPLTFSLYPTADNNVEYRWFVMGKKDSLESTEKKPTFTLENTGRYTVKMIAFHPNGCSDTLIKKEFMAILEPENGKNTPEIVPISATIVAETDGSEDLTVTINSVQKNTFSIAVLNELGAVISTDQLSFQGLKSTKIKTRNLPVGAYHIIIKTKEGKEVLQRDFGKK